MFGNITSRLGRLALIGIWVPILSLALAVPRAAAASLPYHNLDRVYCANDSNFTNIIWIPQPVIYAMDYRPRVLDYQWVTWRVWLYQQVGSSWVAVNAQNPAWGQWQPPQKVHDRDIDEAYWFSANSGTFGIPVTRGANYKVAFQVYWYNNGAGATVPVAQHSPWTWASAHMNDSGFGWGQFVPDLCNYPVVTGVVNLQ